MSCFGCFGLPPVKEYVHPDQKPHAADGAAPQYSKEELESATDGFRHQIGQGGFGKVFKGFLRDPAGGAETPVAVKMCTAKVLAAKEQLMTEMIVMSTLQHRYILKLLGSCLDTGDGAMAMIYEFIPNGDAFEKLKEARAGLPSFPWSARLQVAVGCAEALAYIHSCEYVHRDFKASNVLLAEHLEPRVADFGVARIVEDWKEHVTTRVVGSMGYIDPEYITSGFLNDKCDTYAFGVFLVELATADTVTNKAFSQTLNATVHCANVDLDAVMDSTIKGQYSQPAALKFFEVARQTITYDWDSRPTMEEVADMLREIE